MNDYHTQPSGQQNTDTSLQPTTRNLAYPSATAGSNSTGHDQDDHILVHFNGHFNGQFNGAFLVPSNMSHQAPAESDAQIAARRAMAKRSSRSFGARVSRSRSRKIAAVGRATKPGITVDTSFARHRGEVPHQVFPRDVGRQSGGSIRKQGWHGLARSDTKNKGLGIMKGTPQPGFQSEDRGYSQVPGSSADGRTPKTADSQGNKSWQEISPWDRPIPIGITVPSDSVTDFSPHRMVRRRSDSDATLATPNIVITPAAAMKSMWSPDTASDYTPARASSIYSRATFWQPSPSEVPPIPNMPADMQKLSAQQAVFGTQRDWQPRARTDTVGSDDTAFEEEQDDFARKDRILSTATVFEEDDSPYRERKPRALSVDTSMVPTPRRSQGWWNVITTPFVMSRTNSVWTRDGRHGDKTPDMPSVPADYGTYRNSPLPSSTFWSETDRSASPLSASPMRSMPFVPAAMAGPEACDRSQGNGINVTVVNEASVKNFAVPPVTQLPSNAPAASVHGSVITTPEMTLPNSKHSPEISSLSSKTFAAARSASPPSETAANGAFLMSHYPHFQQQPINLTVEIHDRRVVANEAAGVASTATTTQTNHVVVAPVPIFNQEAPSSTHATPQAAMYFPPPPSNDTAASSHTPPAASLFPPPLNVTTARNQTPPQVSSLFPPPPTTASRSQTPPQIVPQSASLPSGPAPSSQTPPQSAPFFPPPPSSASNPPKAAKAAKVAKPVKGSKDKRMSVASTIRASSPDSTVLKAEPKKAKKEKKQKKHRKMNKLTKLMFPWLALFGNKKGAKNEEDGEKADKDDKDGKDGKTKKRRNCCIMCCCCIIILILLAIIIPLVVVFTRKGRHNAPPPVTGTPDTSDDGPTQWLNDTGYPPMKVGVLTIAQPEAVEEQSGCVAPTTLWSCALPKEQHKDVSPNKPDQPNFRVHITFQNGSDAALPQPKRRAANAASAGAFIRSLLRSRADATPSPAVPSVEDMKFLGQTTDGNSAPFEGETTPFMMSFQDPAPAPSSRLARRDDDPTNITSTIPPPSLNPDGTAAAANLLPLPASQPLRLFNRGKPDEHYGFYTYFDRSIFLKSINATSGRGGNPADIDGGSLRDAASLRCTFTQTRFLVQIWTRSQSTKPLLGGPSSSNSDANSDKNNTTRPGSFPYPVTFTLDRHGGDFVKKNLFCYRMQSDGTIVDRAENKFFRFEDRGFGGNLVNGTTGRGNGQVKGPIDGGSGGCSCKWQNWAD